jgi:predicted alpha/beta hydrolase
MPEPIAFRAADGYVLRGFCWRSEAREAARPVVVINAATSVRCRYYFRFADFLFAHGFDVVAYDYRGIGESRPARLRGFKAGWTDWGRLDVEAVLRWVGDAFPGRPIRMVAHSIGGYLIGLAESASRLDRIVTVGAQHACWRDYAAAEKIRMLAKWHVAMPLLTWACGYFPGRRLGWLEDTPSGVVWDWAFGRLPDHAGFARLTAPVLALSLTDDPFGTSPAIERVLAYYGGAPRTHLRLSPAAVGEAAVGHFAFFHSRLERALWPLPLEWLRSGRLPADHSGEVIGRRS